MSKRRVWGVEFEEPSCPYDDIVETGVTKNTASQGQLLMGLIPFFGLGAALASALFGLWLSRDNRYGNAEAAWKAAVFLIPLQTVYIVFTWVWVL